MWVVLAEAHRCAQVCTSLLWSWGLVKRAVADGHGWAEFMGGEAHQHCCCPQKHSWGWTSCSGDATLTNICACSITDISQKSFGCYQQQRGSTSRCLVFLNTLWVSKAIMYTAMLMWICTKAWYKLSAQLHSTADLQFSNSWCNMHLQNCEISPLPMQSK